MNDSALVWNPNAATRRRYTTNATNQYADDGQYPLTYDARGNLTNDGLYALGYNAKNQLVSAAGQGTAATYAYDALGRRASKTVNSNTTSFLYDGTVEIATYDNAGALKERVIPGPGLDNVLVVIAGTSKFYQHSDVLGSVMMVSDQAGVIVKKFSYGPYGETDQADTSPFRHAGRRFDAETGIYFNRARHYSPRLGRFLQPDPIGVAGGINIYTYAANNPTAFVDPSGLCWEYSAMRLHGGHIGRGLSYNCPPGSIMTRAGSNGGITIDGSSVQNDLLGYNYRNSFAAGPTNPSQNLFVWDMEDQECMRLSSGCGYWTEASRNNYELARSFNSEQVFRVQDIVNSGRADFTAGEQIYMNLIGSGGVGFGIGSAAIIKVTAIPLNADLSVRPSVAAPDYFDPVQHEIYYFAGPQQLVLRADNASQSGRTRWVVEVPPLEANSEPGGTFILQISADALFP